MSSFRIGDKKINRHFNAILWMDIDCAHILQFHTKLDIFRTNSPSPRAEGLLTTDISNKEKVLPKY